jgi:hypothetical protein
VPGRNKSLSAHTDTPLRIFALGTRVVGPSSPERRSYTERVNRIVLERTGVSCEWPVPPRDWTLDRLIAHASASGTMPHVLSAGTLFEEPANRKVLLDEGVALDITPDLVKKHMPLYCARLARYGWPVEDVLATHRDGGRNHYVPIGFTFGEFPALLDHPGACRPGTRYYTLSFRDDILARVFPGARTEAELLDLFIRKGSLDVTDLTGDIPLESLADLRSYLEAVKSLRIVENGRPIVPGSLAATPDPFSIYWSLCTAAGHFWNFPLLFGDPPDWSRCANFFAFPEGMDFLSWWNGAYRDGLVDPELFDLTNEQFASRQREGRYAVINDWHWSSDAREAARSRGYGYRVFPLFLGRWNDLWSNYAQPLECTEHPLVFTRRISNGTELGRVMRWADWHLGEERDVLAHWGLPEWYTGTGKTRRFTWDQHALEDWAVYGIASGCDGDHIGLEHTPAASWNPMAAPRLPTWPFAFFNPIAGYPEAPMWVCPWEPRKLLKATTLREYAEHLLCRARWSELRQFYRGERVGDIVHRLPETIAYLAARDVHGERVRSLLREAVTCGPGRFERAHRAYLEFLDEIGLTQCRHAAIERLRAAWKTGIEPNIVLDRRRGEG